MAKKNKTGSIRLDLGCGQRTKEGFVGVDLHSPTADIKADLFSFPWKWCTQVVEEVWCSHFFEHIPGNLRPRFMDELWRVLKPCGCKGKCPENEQGSLACPQPGGKVTIIVPYYSSMRAVQDFTHAWPPVCEASFMYFNRKWMEMNGLSHYGVKCDFNFGYGYVVDPMVQSRTADAQQFAIKHYINAAMDLQVVLSKRGSS